MYFLAPSYVPKVCATKPLSIDDVVLVSMMLKPIMYPKMYIGFRHTNLLKIRWVDRGEPKLYTTFRLFASELWLKSYGPKKFLMIFNWISKTENSKKWTNPETYVRLVMPSTISSRFWLLRNLRNQKPQLANFGANPEKFRSFPQNLSTRQWPERVRITK